MVNDMLFNEEIDAIPEEVWEEAVGSHLRWGKTWHGDLPADVFFGVWAALVRDREPLVVTVQGDADRPVLSVPSDSPLTVENNRIVLDDGRELVLQFAMQGCE
jgi:hypothetical protein